MHNQCPLFRAYPPSLYLAIEEAEEVTKDLQESADSLNFDLDALQSKLDTSVQNMSQEKTDAEDAEPATPGNDDLTQHVEAFLSNMEQAATLSQSRDELNAELEDKKQRVEAAEAAESKLAENNLSVKTAMENLMGACYAAFAPPEDKG